jgi:hypothetical protein
MAELPACLETTHVRPHQSSRCLSQKLIDFSERAQLTCSSRNRCQPNTRSAICQICLQRRISLTVRDLCMKFSMRTPSRTSRHGFVEMHRDQESIHTLAAGATRGAGAGGMNTTEISSADVLALQHGQAARRARNRRLGLITT